MWKQILTSTAAALIAASPAAAQAPGPVDPETGKIAGFTYGKDTYNSYTSWSGSFPWTWSFSSQHIGYQGQPVAGKPFYLHAHTSVVAPHSVTGNVLITIDQDAGGLPLRYTPSAAMPSKCTLVQFDPVIATTDRPCRSTVTVESGQFVVSQLEPLVPGFGFAVELPVTTASPTTGSAAMTAMWATDDVTLSTNNVPASVDLTVAPNPVVGTTRTLPKALRKYPKVKSLTPGVCTVAKRKITVRAPGLCTIKAKMPGQSKVVKIRFGS